MAVFASSPATSATAVAALLLLLLLSSKKRKRVFRSLNEDLYYIATNTEELSTKALKTRICLQQNQGEIIK